MSRRRREAALVVLGVVLESAACRQVTGLDDFRTEPAAVDAASDALPTFPARCDGVAYSDVDCRDCVDASCCDEATACAADPGCAAMTRCLARCAVDDHECRGTCNVSVAAHPTALADLVRCEAKSCTACGMSRLVAGGPKCDACFATKCATAIEGFSKSGASADERELDPGRDCRCPASVFGDRVCLGCSGGGPHLEAMGACFDGPCHDSCTAPDWSCLGSVEWPPPVASLKKLDFAISLVKAEDFTTPLEGFEVSACSEQDIDCAAPTVVGTTDERGLAQLEIPAGFGPGAGKQFFGHLLVRSEGYPNALLYFFPPPRQSPHVWLHWAVISKSLANGVSGVLGRKLDPKKGGLAFAGAPCNFAGSDGSEASAGIVVAIDSGEPAYYLGPTGAPDPGATQMSRGGFAIFGNVEPGPRRVDVNIPKTKQHIGTYRVLVRPDSFTTFGVAPSPEEVR